MVESAESVLSFWVDTVGIEHWYMSTPEIDREITDRFMVTYEAARDGNLDSWQDDARGSLALLLLLDQFPRNMFRDDPRSFATDPMARAVARAAIECGQDKDIDGLVRQFFYLPFEHSEDLADQEYGYQKFLSAMPDLALGLLHARAHHEIIRIFGRFPFRNKVLARTSTPKEEEFMEKGGYMAFVDDLEQREKATAGPELTHG